MFVTPGAAIDCEGATPRDKRAGVVLDFGAHAAAIAEDPEVAQAAKELREGRLVYRVLKRGFDVVFSAAVLVCLSPLLFLLALAIKIDDPSGPILFKQERVGRDGERFLMYKFRSMVPDAEARLHDIKKLNEKTGPVFKMKDDPRVTRVGRIMRKFSVDELPQFINVLTGDMSVVGPRPALPRETAEYGPREHQRLLVRPGLTCYWQTCKHRDTITFDEWVDMDLAYIKDCSVALDLKLVAKTVVVVLTAQGS